MFIKPNHMRRKVSKFLTRNFCYVVVFVLRDFVEKISMSTDFVYK